MSEHQHDDIQYGDHAHHRIHDGVHREIIAQYKASIFLRWRRWRRPTNGPHTSFPASSGSCPGNGGGKLPAAGGPTALSAALAGEEAGALSDRSADERILAPPAELPAGWLGPEQMGAEPGLLGRAAEAAEALPGLASELAGQSALVARSLAAHLGWRLHNQGLLSAAGPQSQPQRPSADVEAAAATADKSKAAFASLSDFRDQYD